MAIPKRIIQTHRNADLHAEHRKTWIDLNPGFEYLFFDDAACDEFISRHYPEYSSTYEKLPLKAQKADFFRYLAIHHHGGFYADVDTICRQALQDYLDFDSTSFVAGIEMTPDLYKHGPRQYQEEYVAPRQFLQWAFAASAGHPALAALAATIHRTVSLLSREHLVELCASPRFVLETTGPIAFTQAIRYFTAFRPGSGIHVLPQIYWGYSPWHNTDIQSGRHPDVKLIHLFHGSWRSP